MNNFKKVYRLQDQIAEMSIRLMKQEKRLLDKQGKIEELTNENKSLLESNSKMFREWRDQKILEKQIEDLRKENYELSEIINKRKTNVKKALNKTYGKNIMEIHDVQKGIIRYEEIKPERLPYGFKGESIYEQFNEMLNLVNDKINELDNKIVYVDHDSIIIVRNEK